MEDLFATVQQLGLRVVLRVGYGLDPDDPLVQDFGQELVQYKQQTMGTDLRLDTFGFTWQKTIKFWKFPFLRAKLKKRVEKIKALTKEIIEKEKYLQFGETNWFGLLVKANLPLPVIADELNHIYGAVNAIDYTLTCALCELSKNPALASKVRSELQQVISQRGFPQREDFGRLLETTCFMKEVFRYYPVAIAVMRQTGEGLSVGDIVYPKGKEVLILIHAMHHHPRYWDDPATFNPDRWKATLQTPNAYIPFLTRPRQCIGKHLAELHFMVTLNAILSICRIDVDIEACHLTPDIIPRFAHKIPAKVNVQDTF